MLPYLVLHAARMHPIDLRREVSVIRGPGDVVALALGSVRSLPSRRLELLMQVAIELLMEDQKMEWELARDPAFRRLAHDALYFISRRWESDAPDLRFDKDGETCFTKYLIDRMETELPEAKPPGHDAQPAKSNNTTADNSAPDTKTEEANTAADTKPVNNPPLGARAEHNHNQLLAPSFTTLQINFLFDFVRRLAHLLAAPENVRAAAIAHQEEIARKNPSDQPPRFDARVLDALKFTDPGPLLQLGPGSDSVFIWRYNRAGRLLVIEPTPEEAAKAPQVELGKHASVAIADADLVKAFNDVLLDLTSKTINCGNLGATFGVISLSPAWPSVQPALERLTSAPGEYPQRSDDISIVSEFAQLLRRGARVIALSIYCGWVIGNWRHNKDEQQVFRGLQTVSAALGLKELREEQVAKQIDQLGEKMLPRNSPELSLSDAASVEIWHKALEKLIEDARQSKLLQLPINQKVQDRAWRYWRQRLQQTSIAADLSALICAVAGAGPSRVVSFPPEKMTARAWSEAFYLAVTASKETSTPNEQSMTPVPPWLALVALQRLGFNPEPGTLYSAVPLLFPNVAANDLPELYHWKTFASVKASRSSMIIVSKAEVESEKWVPDREWPVLVLCAVELLKLTQAWGKNQHFLVSVWLKQKWLVFDWSLLQPQRREGDLPVVSAEELASAREIIRAFSGDSPLRGIPAIIPGESGPLPEPFFPVIAPISLDQLLLTVARREAARNTQA